MGKTKTLWILAAAGCILIADSAMADGVRWPGHFPPRKFYAGFRFDFGSHTYHAQMQLAPWYSYFPYEAYFNAPPPLALQYPNWPSPFPPEPTPAPIEKTSAPHAPLPAIPVRHAGHYYQQAPPPAYWYGR